MRKEKFKKIFIGLMVFLLCFNFFLPTVVSASKALDGAKEVATGIYEVNTVDENTIPKFYGTVVGVILSLLGTIFIILMIVAGIMWMTSAGNEEKAKKATGIISAAVIGLIITISAYAVWTFVFDRIVSI